MMKKLLWIVVLVLLWCNVVQAATAFATCSGGYCKFTSNIVYDWAYISCQQTLLGEFVIIEPRYIMIMDDSGEICEISEGGDN